LGLSARQSGLNLQLSDLLDVSGNQPGKTGSNHLLPTHRETIHLSLAKPDGMGLMLAINPGQFNWPGFFYALFAGLPKSFSSGKIRPLHIDRQSGIFARDFTSGSA